MRFGGNYWYLSRMTRSEMGIPSRTASRALANRQQQYRCFSMPSQRDSKVTSANVKSPDVEDVIYDVVLDHGDISKCSCSCPYAVPLLCKHIRALIWHLGGYVKVGFDADSMTNGKETDLVGSA